MHPGLNLALSNATQTDCDLKWRGRTMRRIVEMMKSISNQVPESPDSPVTKGSNNHQPVAEYDRLPQRVCSTGDRNASSLRNGTSVGQNSRSINRICIAVWLSAKEAASKLSCSTDTIERRAIPWQENAVQHKIRFKFLVLDEGAEPTRRYFEADVEALLFTPNVLPAASRRRLISKFVRRASSVV